MSALPVFSIVVWLSLHGQVGRILITPKRTAQTRKTSKTTEIRAGKVQTKKLESGLRNAKLSVDLADRVDCLDCLRYRQRLGSRNGRCSSQGEACGVDRRVVIATESDGY